jgi:hypothetical protein
MESIITALTNVGWVVFILYHLALAAMVIMGLYIYLNR